MNTKQTLRTTTSTIREERPAAARDDGELSEAELDQVSGGMNPQPLPPGGSWFGGYNVYVLPGVGGY